MTFLCYISPFTYYTTIPVCGVPPSHYTTLAIPGDVTGTLDFTTSAIYKLDPTGWEPTSGLGLVDPHSWSYGTFSGGIALSYTTSGASNLLCDSLSARVVLYCSFFGPSAVPIADTNCDCKQYCTYLLYTV